MVYSSKGWWISTTICWCYISIINFELQKVLVRTSVLVRKKEKEESE